MATIVASRYAVLSVDDDEDGDSTSKKKKISNKKPAVIKPQNSGAIKANGNSKKKKKQENAPTTGAKNHKPSSGSSTKKKKQSTSEQWEEWKEKDTKFVEGNFEEDLSKAILLSKLDYEKKKDYYESNQKSEEEKQSSNKKNKKNLKDQKVMFPSEYNSLGFQNKCKKDLPNKRKTEVVENNSEFFSKLNEDIKNELSKDSLLNFKRTTDLDSQESLTLVLYKACIEKRDREIDQLKEELERLNIQLKNVKTRNTKLCQIIANGEMKDKAEVLMEVERLQTIKDELSSEVANLHIQLEQERSKVRQLTAEHKNKDKSKKHPTS